MSAPTTLKRYACTECGSTHSRFAGAARCHWGIAAVADRDTDPDEWYRATFEGPVCDQCGDPAISITDHGRGRSTRLCALHANVGMFA